MTISNDASTWGCGCRRQRDCVRGTTISGNATTWRFAAISGDVVALRLHAAHDSVPRGATSGYLGKILGHAIARCFIAVS